MTSIHHFMDFTNNANTSLGSLSRGCDDKFD